MRIAKARDRQKLDPAVDDFGENLPGSYIIVSDRKLKMFALSDGNGGVIMLVSGTCGSFEKFVIALSAGLEYLRPKVIFSYRDLQIYKYGGVFFHKSSLTSPIFLKVSLLLVGSIKRSLHINF